MKKIYMKPATEVCNIKPTQMIMSSPPQVGVSSGVYSEDYDDL